MPALNLDSHRVAVSCDCLNSASFSRDMYFLSSGPQSSLFLIAFQNIKISDQLLFAFKPQPAFLHEVASLVHVCICVCNLHHAFFRLTSSVNSPQSLILFLPLDTSEFLILSLTYLTLALLRNKILFFFFPVFSSFLHCI